MTGNHPTLLWPKLIEGSLLWANVSGHRQVIPNWGDSNHGFSGGGNGDGNTGNGDGDGYFGLTIAEADGDGYGSGFPSGL